MGAMKAVIEEAFDAIQSREIKRLGDELWDQWVKKYANGVQTPIGHLDDVYDIFSDFSIVADEAGLDATATFAICSEALTMLADGKDPYEIQYRIDEMTEVYVNEQGYIVIGKIAITN